MTNYERKHKLNQRQKYFLMAIGKGWLARSKSREWLWLFREKPTEIRENYCTHGGYVLSPMMYPEFPFIKNGDEPYSIEEMLNWEMEGEGEMEMITDILSDTLKPCPFCGKQISIAEVQFDKFGVGRLKIQCCMDFDIFADELIYSEGKRGYARVGFDAVQKWNRRENERH